MPSDPHNTFYEKIITISQSVLEGWGFVFAHVQCAHSWYLEKKVIFSLICCKCVGSLDYTLNILWVSVGICSQCAICSTYLWVYAVCYLWVSLGSAGTEVSSAQSLTMHFARHLSAQNHRLCCRSAQEYGLLHRVFLLLYTWTVQKQWARAVHNLYSASF